MTCNCFVPKIKADPELAEIVSKRLGCDINEIVDTVSVDGKILAERRFESNPILPVKHYVEIL